MLKDTFRFALGEFVETHALGGGVFPTMANVNHSCDPNFTIVNFLGHHAVAFANRTINKGEELHDTYGAVFYHMDKAERQHYLKVFFKHLIRRSSSLARPKGTLFGGLEVI